MINSFFESIVPVLSNPCLKEDLLDAQSVEDLVANVSSPFCGFEREFSDIVGA